MIFDDLKLIFVHVPRTGGTSIEKSLCELAGLQDQQLASTLPPNQLIEHAGSEKWNTYHKFTVVRNPFDRLVSNFFFGRLHALYTKDDLINNRTNEIVVTPQVFSSYIKSVHDYAISVDRLPDQQVNWLLAGGCFANHIGITSKHEANELIVNRVLRFETLESDFNNMLADLGHSPQKLLHLNRTIRHSYQSYFFDQEIAWIQKDYEADLQTFNYTYEYVTV